MEEKGRPWLSKLGVATETTGVVSEWVDWETPRRWALFCRRKQSVRGGRRVGCFTQGPTPKPTWATQGPGGLPQHGRPQRHTHTGAYRGAEIHGRNVYAQMCPHLHGINGQHEIHCALFLPRPCWVSMLIRISGCTRRSPYIHPPLAACRPKRPPCGSISSGAQNPQLERGVLRKSSSSFRARIIHRGGWEAGSCTGAQSPVRLFPTSPRRHRIRPWTVV